MVSHFNYRFFVNVPLESVWQFHDDPIALTQVMTFPVRAVVHSVDRPVQAGSKVRMTFWFGPVPVKWNVVVRERSAPHMFRDEQPVGEGPFARWQHTHRFEAAPGGAWVIDHIEYQPPWGEFGRILDKFFGKWAMTLMFKGRERATKQYLEQAHTPTQTP